MALLHPFCPVILLASQAAARVLSAGFDTKAPALPKQPAVFEVRDSMHANTKNLRKPKPVVIEGAFLHWGFVGSSCYHDPFLHGLQSHKPQLESTLVAAPDAKTKALARFWFP